VFGAQRLVSEFRIICWEWESSGKELYYLPSIMLLFFLPKVVIAS